MKTQPENLSWENLQDTLAEKNGLAIVLVDNNSSAVSYSNNNSICRALYNSPEFAPECAKFCGRAFEMVKESGAAVEYKCYAGLTCKAVPVNENSAAIVGRVFLKAEDYRAATERAISGDWQKFAPSEFFENVLLSGSTKHLETLANRLQKLRDNERNALETFVGKIRKTEEIPSEKVSQTEELSKLVEQFNKNPETVTIANSAETAQTSEEAEEVAEWRSLFGSLFNLSYEQAFQAILEFVTKQYNLQDLAWLERKSNHLEIVYAVGNLKTRNLQIRIAADDKRLIEAARNDSALEFREKRQKDESGEPQKIRLFPIAVGSEVGNALIVGDKIEDEKTKKHIARFCHSVASSLEILRLREEIARRMSLENALWKFSENLKNVDSEDFWTNLAQVSAELLRAERSSILLFDEESESFSVKAAVGSRAEIIKNLTENVGARVATTVFAEGKAAIVKDVNKIGLRAAPSDWEYKTDSFISYPITVGKRKIGVLNFSDRIGSSVYGERDLEILNAIAPQMGVLIDRFNLKHQASDFEHQAVTDALTGLLNRRYLEPRLEEEIKRSNRYGYPMSFVLIDIDDFGKFNKDFGVQTGDEVLRQAVKAMAATLRGEDVAARYGGEEFCVLLPQTNLREAVSIAERMRQSVEKIDFPSRKITISLGVTTFSHEISTSETIIRTADEALRKAKQSGKNNVKVFESSERN